MNVTIRGIEFADVDMTEAETMEAYEEGLAALTKYQNTIQSKKPTAAQTIRDLCDMLRDWFDGVLGEGSGEAILPNDSLKDGASAMRDLIAAANTAKKELDSIWTEFAQETAPTMSRKERRAAQRVQSHNPNRHKGKGEPPRQEAASNPYDPRRLGDE